MAKKRINISVSLDTEKRLKQYALENHTTVSQAVTDWIWSVDVNSNLENKVQKDNEEKFNFELDFGLGNII